MPEEKRDPSAQGQSPEQPRVTPGSEAQVQSRMESEGRQQAPHEEMNEQQLRKLAVLPPAALVKATARSYAAATSEGEWTAPVPPIPSLVFSCFSIHTTID